MNIRPAALLFSVAVIFAGVYFYTSTSNNEASVSTEMPVPAADKITETVAEAKPAATGSSDASAPSVFQKPSGVPRKVSPLKGRPQTGEKQPDPPARIAQETAVPSNTDE